MPSLLPFFIRPAFAALAFGMLMTLSHAADPAPGKKTNRLAKEKSPYLLQHKHNPVDWYPWGEEAFAKAKRENKPVFLSIGYSTCHWCHVMERECFEDEEVAKLLNDTFVCIKVDREERPDIDNIYMQICQIMTQRGGWPLTIMMTPDKKAFFAGTYFPKKSMGGRIGMIDLVPRVEDIWKKQRDELEKQADQVTEILIRTSKGTPGEGLDDKVLKLGYDQLSERYDSQRGGFSKAPKFPTPHNMMFLLRYHARTGDEKALKMVEKTLVEMRRGGMYDQVGFGFHRYSTDADWLLPHFEKMLYDQALLAMAYTEAFQLTGKAEYRETAREIFTYVLRDMTSPDGGFYSAEDADSEGEEGKFYVWKSSELDEILGKADADLYRAAFNFVPQGNWKDQATGEIPGTNIPHLKATLAELAESQKTPDLAARLEAARKKLFDVREKRVHPHKDDKVLADWNGLMIAALAKSAAAFDEPAYARAAERAADFVLTKMRDPQGRLLHRYRDGDAALAASVDDYAFMVWGLTELYQATFDVKRLQAAVALNEEMLKHYWDDKDGGLFFTADDSETLILRQKEVYDGAVPSGNSVAMLNLLRLGKFTENPELEVKARSIGKAFTKFVERGPSGHTQLLSALEFLTGPSYEVVVAGRTDALDTREMLSALGRAFVPNKVVVFRASEVEQPAIVKLAPFTERQTAQGGKATAYVCQNYQCNLPTNDRAKMLELMPTKLSVPEKKVEEKKASSADKIDEKKEDKKE